jgi:hypothetical protein
MNETKAPALALPPAIAAYWHAANLGRSDEAAACFTAGARVHDEGHWHTGRAAIAAWVEATTRAARPVVTPQRVEVRDGRHHVVASVAGNFPGSPVELEFLFTLEAGKIATLEIA